jgi:hypothetical protein
MQFEIASVRLQLWTERTNMTGRTGLTGLLGEGGHGIRGSADRTTHEGRRDACRDEPGSAKGRRGANGILFPGVLVIHLSLLLHRCPAIYCIQVDGSGQIILQRTKMTRRQKRNYRRIGCVMVSEEKAVM